MMLVDISKIRSFAEVLQIIHSCANSNAQVSTKISALRKTSLSVARRQGTGATRSYGAKPVNEVSSRPAKVAGNSKGVIEINVGRNDKNLLHKGILPTQVTLGDKKSGPTIVKFVPPSKTQVALYTATITKLHDNLNILSDAIALMKQAFADNKKQPAAVKAAVGLYNEATTLSNDAYEMLNTVAQKHQPQELADTADALETHLLKILPAKNYTEAGRQVYCAIKEKEFYFCNYFEFTELKNSKGFSYPSFYVVLTGVIRPSDKQLHLHLTSLTDFRPPASFPLGVEISDLAAAKKRLMFILGSNDLSAHEKLPMPNSSGVEAIAGVGKKSIKDDVLTIEYAPSVKTEAQKDEVLKAVLVVLGGSKGRNTNFSYTKTARSVKIMLVPKHGSDKLTAGKLLDIKQMLDLTDAQMAALKDSLQH